MEYVISESGLVTAPGRRDLLLSEIIGEYEKTALNNKSCQYIKDEGIIRIKINYDTYSIKLNEQQKVLFESNNLTNPSLIDLQQMIAKYERSMLYIQIKKEVSDGIYPTEGEAINVYSMGLNKELQMTRAELVEDGFRILWPFALIGITLPLWFSDNPLGAMSWPNFAKTLFCFLLLGIDIKGFHGLFCKIFKRGFKNDFRSLNDDRIQLKKLLMKRQDFVNHLESLKQEIEETSEEEIKDIEVTKKYGEVFLNEASIVLGLIQELPSEEQETYSNMMIDIITDYQNKWAEKTNANNNSIALHRAENTWQLNQEFIPKVTDIKREILKKLGKPSEERSIPEQCEELIQHASATQTVSSREWTDGYTDSLTAGNTLHM